MAASKAPNYGRAPRPPSAPAARPAPGLPAGECALASATKELCWARYRLDHAMERLEQLGALSQLRRHRRQEKASALDQVDRFTNDARKPKPRSPAANRRSRTSAPSWADACSGTSSTRSPTRGCAPSTPNSLTAATQPITVSLPLERCCTALQALTSRRGPIDPSKSTDRHCPAATWGSTSGSKPSSSHPAPDWSSAQLMVSLVVEQVVSKATRWRPSFHSQEASPR